MHCSGRSGNFARISGTSNPVPEERPMTRWLFSRLSLIGLVLLSAGPVSATMDPIIVDLRDATVVLNAKSERAKLAAQMLIEEVEKRTGLRWNLVTGRSPKTTFPVIELSLRDDQSWAPEGFAIKLDGTPRGDKLVEVSIQIVGNDERGLMYGCGQFLRLMLMRRGSPSVPANISMHSAPAL